MRTMGDSWTIDGRGTERFSVKPPTLKSSIKYDGNNATRKECRDMTIGFSSGLSDENPDQRYSLYVHPR